jgi:imidazolonepropionase-like amidohydrolase
MDCGANSEAPISIWISTTPAATVTAAEALGRSRDVGAIAVGRYGDLIAVAGDPLADVAILQTVSFAMKGGVVIKQSVQGPAQ